VSDASGDAIFQTNGPANPGVHNVVWPYSITRTTTPAPRVLSPAERRDSILLNVRAPMVLDSLRKVGYDTAAIGSVQRAVDAARNPAAAAAVVEAPPVITP
jgi:hypothetical protein